MTDKSIGIKKQPDSVQLLAQLNVLATSNNDPGFLSDLAALVSKYQDKSINIIAPASLPDSRTVPETIAFKPTYHTWRGKFPENGGSTDWFGSGIGTRFDIPDFTSFFNLTVKLWDFHPDTPLDNLPRMAVGSNNITNQIIMCSTLIDEAGINFIENNVPGGGGKARPTSINEFYSSDSITHEQIVLGHGWLNPARRQNVFIPASRLSTFFSPRALSALSEVFNIHPIDYQVGMDPEIVAKNLKASRSQINLDLPIESGVITRKEFWIQHASAIASALDGLRGTGEFASASDIPVIIHEKFGDTPHAQFEFALDLIEAVVILRGKFLPSWSASHVCRADSKNVRPSLSVISPNFFTQTDLAKIDNVTIVDDTTPSPNTAVVIAYLEGQLSLEEARKYFE